MFVCTIVLGINCITYYYYETATVAKIEMFEHYSVFYLFCDASNNANTIFSVRLYCNDDKLYNYLFVDSGSILILTLCTYRYYFSNF